MSFSRLTSSGNAQLQFRLRIEGAPEEWVSHRSMAGATGTQGVVRYYGLIPTGFTFGERLILQEAYLEADPMSFRIDEDRSQIATYAFARVPDEVALLQEDIDASETSWDVDDNTSMTLSQFYHVGTECILLSAKPTATNITVVRARRNTTAQNHYNQFGGKTEEQPIYDAIPAYRGRRCYLYAHSGNELAVTDDGTLIWTGILSGEPKRQSPVSWTLSADPLTKLLDQPAAVSIPVTGLRGHYYPWAAPFVFRITEWATTTDNSWSELAFDTGTASTNDTGYVKVTGFYETVDDLREAIDAAIATATSGFTNTYWVEGDNRGGSITRLVGKQGGDPWYAEVWSMLDGYIGSGLAADADLLPYNSERKQVSGSASTPIANDTVLYFPLKAQCKINGVPAPSASSARGWLGIVPVPLRHADNNFYSHFTDQSAKVSAPNNLLYLSPPASVESLDAISIDAVNSSGEGIQKTLQASGFDTSAGWVELAKVNVYATLTRDSEIKEGSFYGEGGTLDNFREQLLLQASDANSGNTPFLTANDVNSSTWTATIIAAAKARPLVSRRNYLFTKQHKLWDILKPELILLGLIPWIDSLGKISVRPLKLPSQTGNANATLDDTNILSGEGRWPRWSRGEGGVVNVVTLKRGYNTFTNEYELPDINVRYAKSIAANKQSFSIQVAPLSSSDTEKALTDLEAANIASPILSYLGNPFFMIEIDVGWTAFDIRIGDIVDVTSKHLPDVGAGTNGVVGLRGLCIGRAWSVPGFGKLTILTNGLRVSGYAPSALLTSGSVVSGSQWSFTTGANTYNSASSDTDISFFAVGDIVEIVQIDSTSPTTQTGVVDSIGTNQVTITFDGAVFGGGAYTANTYTLQFRENATAYTPSSNQEQYCYIGDSTRTLWNNTRARVLG